MKLTVHGKGRHGEVVTGVALMLDWDQVKITDDADGTRPDGKSPCIIAIGDNRGRKACDTGTLVSVIHPTASISGSARIGPGTFVGAGVLVNASAKVGKGCILNTGCIVEHDNVIGDWCHVSPGATLCGTVTLGEGVWVGAGATIKNNVTIAPWTMIGCGSVVLDDIDEPGTYVGNPARRLR